MLGMGTTRAFAITLAILSLSTVAQAVDPDTEDRNVIAPFRFTGPAKELTPVDRQRALAYQNDLERQLYDLDQDEQRGRLDPVDRRLLLDTRSEVGRMKTLLLPLPAAGTGVSGSRPLPSLSGGSPLLSH
jgi:hypothetical protein